MSLRVLAWHRVSSKSPSRIQDRDELNCWKGHKITILLPEERSFICPSGQLFPPNSRRIKLSWWPDLTRMQNFRTVTRRPCFLCQSWLSKKVLYRIGKEEETLPIKKPTVITQRGESKKLILKRLKAFYFRLLLPSFLFKEQNGSCNVSEKEVVWAYKEPLRQTSLQFPTYCL